MVLCQGARVAQWIWLAVLPWAHSLQIHGAGDVETATAGIEILDGKVFFFVDLHDKFGIGDEFRILTYTGTTSLEGLTLQVTQKQGATLRAALPATVDGAPLVTTVETSTATIAHRDSCVGREFSLLEGVDVGYSGILLEMSVASEDFDYHVEGAAGRTQTRVSEVDCCTACHASAECTATVILDGGRCVFYNGYGPLTEGGGGRRVWYKTSTVAPPPSTVVHAAAPAAPPGAARYLRLGRKQPLWLQRPTTHPAFESTQCGITSVARGGLGGTNDLYASGWTAMAWVLYDTAMTESFDLGSFLFGIGQQPYDHRHFLHTQARCAHAQTAS